MESKKGPCMLTPQISHINMQLSFMFFNILETDILVICFMVSKIGSFSLSNRHSKYQKSLHTHTHTHTHKHHSWQGGHTPPFSKIPPF